MRRGHRNRGSMLIVSYLVLSAFLVYSNAMTMHTLIERRAQQQQVEKLQALDLAQGAIEQLRERLSDSLTAGVYQQVYQGDAIKAMKWLDSQTSDSPEAPIMTSGTSVNPECLTRLPTIKADRCLPTTTPAEAPRAWITRIVKDPAAALEDPLAPRLVTMEAEANVGATTRHLRVTYRIELGMSDIFRYAYFVNNYGWFDIPGSTRVFVHGEVRANGDLAFSGNAGTNAIVNGDLYASANPELSAAGMINGDPTQRLSQLDYWQRTTSGSFPMARPTRHVTLPGQPPIGGEPETLPYGFGWDSDYPTPARPDQQRFGGQPTHPIPYLGNIADFTKRSYYRELAMQRHGTLTYNDDANGDGRYGGQGDSSGNGRPVVSAVYYGPDGISGTADDTTPLILVGTGSNPIVLNGPVVVPGDVIIKGTISGRGTIYAGRNIHVVGGVAYASRPSWPALERDPATGRIRERGVASGPRSNLGTVAEDGAYTPPPRSPCP